MTHGLPVDRVDRLVLAGVTFPEHWQALIERCAGTVRKFPATDAGMPVQPT
jgi:hypothetical protein